MKYAYIVVQPDVVFRKVFSFSPAHITQGAEACTPTVSRIPPTRVLNPANPCSYPTIPHSYPPGTKGTFGYCSLQSHRASGGRSGLYNCIVSRLDCYYVWDRAWCVWMLLIRRKKKKKVCPASANSLVIWPVNTNQAHLIATNRHWFSTSQHYRIPTDRIDTDMIPVNTI